MNILKLETISFKNKLNTSVWLYTVVKIVFEKLSFRWKSFLFKKNLLDFKTLLVVSVSVKSTQKFWKLERRNKNKKYFSIFNH